MGPLTRRAIGAVGQLAGAACLLVLLAGAERAAAALARDVTRSKPLTPPDLYLVGDNGNGPQRPAGAGRDPVAGGWAS